VDDRREVHVHPNHLAVGLTTDAEAEALIHALGIRVMTSQPPSNRLPSAGSRS